MKFYPLKGYEDLYKINKSGKIINSKNEIITTFLSPDGYVRITLYKNGKRKNYYLHQLIAKQFIPNPKLLKEIDHINKIRTDNKISNLRWSNRSLNNLNK